MSQTPPVYALSKVVRGSFDDVATRVRDLLATEGFGILCEIDVSGILKKKLDVDQPRMLILGACNPPLAHKAISAEPYISVFLPCNVVVRDLGDGQLEVATINPLTMAQMIQNDDVDQVASEVNRRLTNALDALD